MARSAIPVVSLAGRMLAGGDCHVGIRRAGAAGFRMGWHRHRGFVELVLGLRGRFTHRIRRTGLVQEEGMWTWVGEADAHELDGRGCVWANIALALPLWRRILAVAGRGALPRAGGLRQAAPGRAADWMQRMAPWEGCAGDTATQCAVAALVLDLLAGPPSRPQDAAAGAAPDWWLRLIRELEAERGAPPRAQALPPRCGKSAAHLARTFRKHLGGTPSAYLNGLRLERAARRLAAGEDPPAAIAYDCGFESLGYFYTLFRRRFRCSPLEYRTRAHALG